MSSLDIEKESLEAHVDLCSERYKRMEDKLDNLDSRITGIEEVLVDIRDKMFADMAIIGALVSAVAFLTYQLIINS